MTLCTGSSCRVSLQYELANAFEGHANVQKTFYTENNKTVSRQYELSNDC